MKPNRRHKNAPLVGFQFDPANETARFSMYVPGGGGRLRRRATVHATSYEEAVRLWSDFREGVQAGAKRMSAEAPTFGAFVNEYFPLIAANVSPKTARDYGYAIRRHLLPAFAVFRLTEMTSAALNAFGARLKSDGYAGATINGYVSLAALLLGYAVEFDVIAELPLKKKIKKQRANKPCLELNAEERARFLAAFDDRDGFLAHMAEVMPPRHASRNGTSPLRRGGGAGLRLDGRAADAYFLRYRRSKDLFLVALETGLRSGDLLRLEIRNVDLVNGWIRLIQQKTGAEVVIPVSNACHGVLERRLLNRAAESEPVFLTENGCPYPKSTVDRYFKIAKKIARINRRVRFHDLRHAFASSLATAGVPLQFIGKVLGHRSPAMVARYARPDARVLDAVRAALDRP